MLILTVEPFVGLYISQWDNGMNETGRVWKRQTGSLLCDLYNENGCHSIDKVQS